MTYDERSRQEGLDLSESKNLVLMAWEEFIGAAFRKEAPKNSKHEIRNNI
jgi:hypothetical protein